MNERIKRFSFKNQLRPPQILVIGFLIMIVIGTTLLNLPIASTNKQSIGMINALFTATSAVCVTGLTIVETATHWSTFGKIVIIVLIQIGGLGFMTMTTLFFILAGKRISIKERLLIQSSLNKSNLNGIIGYVKYIFLFTIIVEIVGTLLYALRFVPEYGVYKGMGISFFHAISAFCNSGFDIIGGSFQRYVADWIININTFFMTLIGGLGFSVILEIILKKRIKRLNTHAKLVVTMTISLLIISFLLIYIFELNNPNTLKGLDTETKILSTLFQSISHRTAGFTTLDITQLSVSSKLLTMILMFIGGAPGSTAGGVKITTIGILLFSVMSVFIGKEDTELFKRRVSFDTVNKAIAIILISFLVILVVTMILCNTENANFLEVSFEVVSAYSTAGLTLDLTSNLSNAGKLAITLTMFIGKLGPLTIGFAIAKRQEYFDRNIRYPKADILIG